ncbi:HrpE/YscL family type III secretion apparatus protein [Achromobacter marplatensis]|uniref:HrpE/YscL family type III secretion apparatus protein n=1 Tax=Achromobacter marplatensis TaxID=470868 RepID=UPI0039F73B14
MAFLISQGPLTPLGLPGRVAPGTRIVRAAEHSALGDAQALIDMANRRAEQIVAGAEAAYEAERARGHEAGRQEANLKAADHMIEAVGRTVEYFANVETTMIDVVMQAVRKLISGFDDRDRVAVVVRNALSVVRNQKQVTLRMHPDDMDVAQGRMNDWLAEFPRMGYVDLVPDPRLARGGCIVESEIGLVEASLDAQLQAMRGAFERVLGSRV